MVSLLITYLEGVTEQQEFVSEPHDGSGPKPQVLKPYTEETLSFGKRHKILLVTHQFSRTGAPRAVLFLAKALFRLHGVRPVIISPSDGPMRDEFEQEGFATVVDPQLFSYQSYSFGACNFVAGFESVIVTSLSSYAFIRYFRGIAKHLSWWIHETESGFSSFGVMASDLALLFAACESIWLGSPLCIPYASQYASRAKLRLLLYGCDDTATPHRPLENGKLVFSVIGSVEPRKGQDVFLNALGCLPDELRRKAVFRIIGSPLGFADSQAFYKKIQATAGRYPEVELIPDVPPDRLQALYSETDVVVSPSRDDPMPIVITQGLMFSAVCLCSSAIGHAQLLEDGKSGLIFATGSAEMLAEKMTWAILNPDALNSIGKAGRETYEKSFEMDGFMENIKSAQGGIS